MELAQNLIIIGLKENDKECGNVLIKKKEKEKTKERKLRETFSNPKSQT